MAFKLRAVNGTNKQYLFPVNDASYGGTRDWAYVTDDTPATVSGSGYIDDSTSDGEMALRMLRVGDLVRVYQVGSIDDDRNVEADMAAGITDYSMHLVLTNTGSVIDMSDDLLSATVTYGS